MHKVRIHTVKSAIKKVKELSSKAKVFISTAVPVTTQKDEDETPEKRRKQSVNVIPILEVTPVTKASDITSLIKPSVSEESEQEETSAQKSLEPLVRDAAKTAESGDSKDSRPYEAPKSQNYSPTTAANYVSTQQNNSQNLQYSVDTESERNRDTPLSNLQPNWEEESSRLPDGHQFAPDNRTHYEPRQYSTPNEKMSASHKRRRLPWE